MKMRNILSDGKSRESLTGSSANSIGSNCTYDLHALSGSGIENGTATDSANRYTVDQISRTEILPSADVAREKAEGRGSNRGVAKPTDFHTNRQPVVGWKKWYRILWKIKLSRANQHNR